MDLERIIAEILRLHKRSNDSDASITRFFAKLKDGSATYADALKFAGRSGSGLAKILTEQLEAAYPAGIPPDVLETVVPAVLTDECKSVLEASGRVQKGINRRARINLEPVDLSVSSDRINGLVEHWKDAGLGDAVETISNLTRSEVDTTARKNAEFQDASGLEVTVSRYYDDVGVNHGKDACQWCLDRCGEDVPYKEAYARGMFERHPGCGCTLEYHTRKGSKRQADWKRNAWEDLPGTLERRRTYGL